MITPLCAVCYKRMSDWYVVCPNSIDCQNKWEHRQWIKRNPDKNATDYIYGVTYELEGEEE